LFLHLFAKKNVGECQVSSNEKAYLVPLEQDEDSPVVWLHSLFPFIEDRLLVILMKNFEEKENHLLG